MRTGIKILARKIINMVKYPTYLYPNDIRNRFPDLGISKFKTFSNIFATENIIKESKINNNLGAIYTHPNLHAIKTYKKFIKYNPNHLGNKSIVKPKQGTELLEYEAIKKMIDLYHAKKENLEGYITTGGTEGNIYSFWLGRSFLQKYCKKDNICALITNLTHYSIRKASNICNTPFFFTPLDLKKWNMNPESLDVSIKNLYKKGYRGFLLPLTFGYTSTGTIDNIEKIVQITKNIKRRIKSVHFYLWIDAAINGMIEPFINKNFSPFKHKLIQSLIVDFHKFGYTPYPSGIVLYRKNLRKLIEKPIEYLEEKDNTLLGSRTGIPAISIWTMINLMGKRGYLNLIKRQLKIKNYFISRLKENNPKSIVITDKNSLSCGIIFDFTRNEKLSKELEQKYWLTPAKTELNFTDNISKSHIIYKFFFLPHVKKNTIDQFIYDLEQNKYGNIP